MRRYLNRLSPLRSPLRLYDAKGRFRLKRGSALSTNPTNERLLSFLGFRGVLWSFARIG